MTLREFLSITADSYLDLCVNEHRDKELIRSFTTKAHEWHMHNIPDDVLDMEVQMIIPFYGSITVEVVSQRRITREMIKEGYEKDLVSLVWSPSDDGVVCIIGDYWFYFGEKTETECKSVEEYKHAVLEDAIIDHIWEALNELYVSGDETQKEYLYYQEYLEKNLKTVQEEIKELWEEFGAVPMDPETECIEEDWNGFPAGTFREDIWHWFEETYDVNVAKLMYEDD